MLPCKKACCIVGYVACVFRDFLTLPVLLVSFQQQLGPASQEKSLVLLEKLRPTSVRALKYAVSECLLEDGGAAALMEAMMKYHTNAPLVTSCLRALFYIGDSPHLVVRMVRYRQTCCPGL
jgi:hypothetical protein